MAAAVVSWSPWSVADRYSPLGSGTLPYLTLPPVPFPIHCTDFTYLMIDIVYLHGILVTRVVLLYASFSNQHPGGHTSATTSDYGTRRRSWPRGRSRLPAKNSRWLGRDTRGSRPGRWMERQILLP